MRGEIGNGQRAELGVGGAVAAPPVAPAAAAPAATAPSSRAFVYTETPPGRVGSCTLRLDGSQTLCIFWPKLGGGVPWWGPWAGLAGRVDRERRAKKKKTFVAVGDSAGIRKVKAGGGAGEGEQSREPVAKAIHPPQAAHEQRTTPPSFAAWVAAARR